jgi:hypothetical protein
MIIFSTAQIYKLYLWMVYTPLMEINTLTDVAVINSFSNKITEIDRGTLSPL